MNKNNTELLHSSSAEYLTYIAANGTSPESIEIRYENENIWLSQKMMAELYDVTVSAINQHIKKILEDGELSEDSVIKKYLITAEDGKKYNTNHYNLQIYMLQHLIMIKIQILQNYFFKQCKIKCISQFIDTQLQNL